MWFTLFFHISRYVKYQLYTFENCAYVMELWHFLSFLLPSDGYHTTLYPSKVYHPGHTVSQELKAEVASVVHLPWRHPEMTLVMEVKGSYETKNAEESM